MTIEGPHRTPLPKPIVLAWMASLASASGDHTRLLLYLAELLAWCAHASRAGVSAVEA